MRKSTDIKVADAVPTPRAKPLAAATLQLASADAQIVPAPKSKPSQAGRAGSADKAEPKPQTPADIINARGFWDDAPTTANQPTPVQIAALRARQAVGAADPQPTASVSEAFNKALAYAPAASSPVDRANIVAASAPIPRTVRPTRNAAVPATEINTVVAKGPQGQGSVISTSTRLAAAKGNDIWMRVVMLAPSASNAMSTTVLGDTDMTHDAQLFRQAAGHDRDDLLGRSDDGHDHRPLQRIGDRQARDAVIRAAHRIAALTTSL